MKDFNEPTGNFLCPSSASAPSSTVPHLHPLCGLQSWVPWPSSLWWVWPVRVIKQEAEGTSHIPRLSQHRWCNWLHPSPVGLGTCRQHLPWSSLLWVHIPASCTPSGLGEGIAPPVASPEKCTTPYSTQTPPQSANSLLSLLFQLSSHYPLTHIHQLTVNLASCLSPLTCQSGCPLVFIWKIQCDSDLSNYPFFFLRNF